MSVKSERSQRSLSFFTSDDDADFEETFFFFFRFMSVMREESIIGNKQIQLFSYLVTAFLVFVCFLVSTTNRLFKHFVPYTQCSNVFSAAVESLIYKMQSASPESVLICKSSRTNSTWVCILGNQRSTDKTK